MRSNKFRIENASKAFLYSIVVSVLSILTIILFHAPHFWLMTEYRPGTFVWDRAHTFLQQCIDPYRSDIEPAMRWRLLIPIICHYLGIQGFNALLIPYIGLLIYLTYVSLLLRAWIDDAKFVVGGTLLIASTSAGLIVTGWLGINDAWVWLGSAVVAFSRSPALIIASGFVAPWIDERFIVALPLVWCIRCQRIGAPLINYHLLWLVGVPVYATVRILFGGNPVTGKSEQDFIHAAISGSLTYAGVMGLGWWMGLRVAWVPVVYSFVGRKAPDCIYLAAIAVLTLIASSVLAFDVSRSTAILCPLVLSGLQRFAERHSDQAPNAVAGLAVAALLIPAMHVVGRKLDPIENVVMEAQRLLR